MVSTFIILCATLLSLFLVWKILYPGVAEIRSVGDWEARRHEVDLDAFRMLLDAGEERYLRTSLPLPEFRTYQRRRLSLALGSLELVGKNATMLMRLGQLAKLGASPMAAKEAEDLIHGALRLRLNVLLVQTYLWLKWFFPAWALSLPAIDIPYEELLSYLTRVREQRQWDVKPGLIAA
jgi:hypothetical protein